jgi:hypothetical protein
LDPKVDGDRVNLLRSKMAKRPTAAITLRLSVFGAHAGSGEGVTAWNRQNLGIVGPILTHMKLSWGAGANY